MIEQRNVLDYHLRKQIYDFILKNPGFHQSKIINNLKIPKSTLKHHLKYLIQNNLVLAKKEDRYLRYYIVKKIGKVEKIYFKFLRQETPRDILIILFYHLTCSRSEISRYLEKHPTTVEYHLKKLLNARLIKIAPSNVNGIYPFHNNKIVKRKLLPNEVVYTLFDTIAFYNFLITYKKCFKDDLSINLVFGPLSYTYKEKPLPNKINDTEEGIDSIVDLLNDIFPLPIIA